jgi:hypothetical protein
VEEKPLNNFKEEIVAKFLYEDIFMIFCVPHEIVIGTQFISKSIVDLMASRRLGT